LCIQTCLYLSFILLSWLSFEKAKTEPGLDVNIGLYADEVTDVDDNEGDMLDYTGEFVSSTPMLDEKNILKRSPTHPST
jgi:hypothetical protein